MLEFLWFFKYFHYKERFFHYFKADFGFARFLHDGVMAATLCGSPMYMVGAFSLFSDKFWINISLTLWWMMPFWWSKFAICHPVWFDLLWMMIGRQANSFWWSLFSGSRSYNVAQVRRQGWPVECWNNRVSMSDWWGSVQTKFSSGLEDVLRKKCCYRA